MPVSEVQRLINAIDNNKTEFTYSPIITERLRDLIKIPESEKKLAELIKQTKDELKQQIKDEHNDDLFKQQIIDEVKQQIKDELKQTKDEFKQQMKIIQELLDNFIKNSNN